MDPVLQAARKANSPERWDALWTKAETRDWRAEVLEPVYSRICELIDPSWTRVVDVGGGVGVLARRIMDTHKGVVCDVRDISLEACRIAQSQGVQAEVLDAEHEMVLRANEHRDCLVSTEVLEHLSPPAQNRLLTTAKSVGRALISVPNDRLGPEVESQHTCQFTAVEFKRFLSRYFEDVRVEVFGKAFLLGVCGFPKGFTLSLTLPVRDEAKDLEITLATFRGVADEMVVGVDPRTTDNTREVARKYAEVVFDFEHPEGPPDKPAEQVPAGGVNFSWARNQCIERCTSDWIFMTEAHERLLEGQYVLLRLGEVMPKDARVGLVLRTGSRQQWAFPWLFRPEFRFTRPTHNILDIPAGTSVVRLPQVKTRHERHDFGRSEVRDKQRRKQNRKSLLDDWLSRGSLNSLYYLGSEWRGIDDQRAKERLEQFLRMPAKNGAARYMARLMLAKMYGEEDRFKAAREVLLRCPEDDWCRTEHWIWLGDLAFHSGDLEEAEHFYRYGATRIGDPPFTLWWIDTDMYAYLPAQRLAMVSSALGKLPEALYWAEQVIKFLPDDAPDEAVEECQRNLETIKEACDASTGSESPGAG